MACNVRSLRRVAQSAYFSSRFSNAVLFSRQPLPLRSLSFSCRRHGPDPPIPLIDDDKLAIDDGNLAFDDDKLAFDDDKLAIDDDKLAIDDDKQETTATKQKTHQEAYSLKMPPDTITIRKKAYPTDAAWFNLPYSVLLKTGRRMHLESDHPVCITRQIIEKHFPKSTFKRYNEISPVVTTEQNFDSLGIPPDHPGRSPSDTYYINKDTLLRTHTSAHQAELFRTTTENGHLIAASVFRRDAVDRSHYPCFHQMEGARYWYRDRTKPDLAAAVLADLESLPKHDVPVEDSSPPWHPTSNPLQEQHHSAAEVEAVGAHLKRSLENMVADLFSRAKAAAEKRAGVDGKRKGMDGGKPLKMRWTEAYFPFTSPSWELEVLYDDEWIEVLGCGVVKQELFINAGAPLKMGWAFGVGIDRLAMLLFQITDIRMLWSHDKRFLSQFTGMSKNLDDIKAYAPISKYPPNLRHVSFWLPLEPTTTTTTTVSPDASASTSVNNSKLTVHPNDVMELVRGVAGNVVEDVKLFDVYTHPETGKKSMAFNIIYRSLESQLSRRAANNFHDKVKMALVDRLGVEIR